MNDLAPVSSEFCVCGHNRPLHRLDGCTGCVCRTFRHATKQNTHQAPNTGMPFPICDRCRSFVRRMVHWQDTKTNQTVLRVFCHGESEDLRLDNVPVPEGAQLTVGRAFCRKAVPATESRRQLA